jgi:hypothetical protein
MAMMTTEVMVPARTIRAELVGGGFIVAVDSRVGE